MNLTKLKNLIKKPKPISHALSWDGAQLRIAVTQSQGNTLHIQHLQSFPFDGQNTQELKTKLKANLATLNISKRTHFGLSLWDESFQIKRVEVPPLPEVERRQAIGQAFVEGSGSSVRDYDFRYFVQTPNSAGESELSYLVYGIKNEALEKTRAWIQNSGLKISICELAPLALAAWQERLCANTSSPAVILCRAYQHADFIGLHQGSLSHWKSFQLNHQREVGEVDLLLQYQQCLENFLLQSHTEELKQIWLAGDWEESESEQLRGLGFPLLDLGEQENPGIAFANESLHERAPQFAAELGTTLFPL